MKKQKWEEEFDKKFTRKNAQTKEYEDKWFIKDCIIAKELKQFISKTIAKERIKGRQDIIDDLLRKFEKIDMEQFRCMGSSGADIFHDALIKILKKYE